MLILIILIVNATTVAYSIALFLKRKWAAMKHKMDSALLEAYSIINPQ